MGLKGPCFHRGSARLKSRPDTNLVESSCQKPVLSWQEGLTVRYFGVDSKPNAPLLVADPHLYCASLCASLPSGLSFLVIP
jgi:hypothetical protein